MRILSKGLYESQWGMGVGPYVVKARPSPVVITFFWTLPLTKTKTATFSPKEKKKTENLYSFFTIHNSNKAKQSCKMVIEY